MSQMQVGLVQMACAERGADNLQRVTDRIRDAAHQGAKFVVLPELFSSRYFPQEEDARHFDLAESIPGPTTEHLSAVARKTRTVLVTSIFERRAAGIFHNTAVAIDSDGRLAGIYRKMHIPDDPLYFEKFYFTPGDLGFGAVTTAVGRIGLQVCWDQWFPEGARLCALSGAALLVYPTAIGWHPAEKVEMGAAQLEAWKTVQRGHAIANGVFVIAVNRVGHEGPQDGGLEFWGHSFVCDPLGVMVAEGGESEELLLAECDLQRIEEIRRGWPFLRDRRVDAYGGITGRFLDGK